MVAGLRLGKGSLSKRGGSGRVTSPRSPTGLGPVKGSIDGPLERSKTPYFGPESRVGQRAGQGGLGNTGGRGGVARSVRSSSRIG